MESDKNTISERTGVLEAGAEGTGGKGPLKIRCFVVEVLYMIVFVQNRSDLRFGWFGLS